MAHARSMSVDGPPGSPRLRRSGLGDSPGSPRSRTSISLDSPPASPGLARAATAREAAVLTPQAGESFVGVLQRQVGPKTYKPFLYCKAGIFLKEYRTGTLNRALEPAREVIDLTGARIVDTVTSSGRPESFAVLARNGRQWNLLALSVEEKSQWLAALDELHGELMDGTRSMRTLGAGSLIAPVRRRQSSSEAMHGMLLRRVAIVESDMDGLIIKCNAAAEHMFGWPEFEVVGQSITVLLAESARPVYALHLEDSKGTTRGKGSLIGQYRRVQGLRRDGSEFNMQISAEVTVEGHMRVRMLEVDPATQARDPAPDDDMSYKTVTNLRVKIFEGKGIGGAKAREPPSPYCVLLLDSVQHGTTTTKADTDAPFWGEEFLLDHIRADSGMFAVAVNTMKQGATDPRIGQVFVDLRSLADGVPLEKWMPLVPMRTERGVADNVGSLRIRCTLIEERILPFPDYADLLDIILEPELTVAYTLSSVAGPALEEIAGTLVNIFASKGRALDFIKLITSREIAATEHANVIFRGNSLTTKVIDLYMKMVGSEYLRDTISALLEEVYQDTESCEIDPSRLAKGESRADNHKRLTIYVIRFWEAIAGSVNKCPPEFGFIYEHLREVVVQKWGDGIEKFTAISGFVFLRFFCPAILNPYLFGLMDEHPTGNVARTLTLIAKTLQSLANLSPSEKEPFMDIMNVFINGNIERMQKCILSFSKPTIRDVRKLAKSEHNDLRRELAALYRHIKDKLPELKQAHERQANALFERLFAAIDKLDNRYLVHERQKALTVRDIQKTRLSLGFAL